MNIQKAFRSITGVLGTLFLLTILHETAIGQVEALDAYWAEVSRTVAEGDYEGYAALYHPDAVLVFNTKGSSVPIADALAGWKQGFDDTRDGKMAAGVTFRFSQRLNGKGTAHETGIFRYAFTPEGGSESVRFIHFEGLLVKKDKWLMTMEYQKAAATEEEWKALEQ